MSLYGLVTALVVSVCCWMLVLAAEEPAPPKPVLPTTTTTITTTTTTVSRPPGTNASTAATSTENGGKRGLGGFGVDSPMIQRALYVLIGITLTGMLYFLIRAVRLKKPAPKKKYGLLSNYDDSVEMEGVESEEDDTLYEARALRR